jgi:hypothetical protein
VSSGFLPLGLILTLAYAAPAAELLHLDFNDSAHMGAQTDSLPTGLLSGATRASRDYTGSLDFGQSGGAIRIPGFKSPSGAYTVEARFRIRNYGVSMSNYIANILSTVPGSHDGLAFRVGGGYLYSPLPRNAYKTNEEWYNAQNGFDWALRERISDCIGAFVMATTDGGWMEVYTDRCIEKNAWTYLVGTWDGERMRIYINGLEATDHWRTVGAGSLPNLQPVGDAWIGARTLESYDPRHFDGVLDFVKAADGALTPQQVHGRYRDTFLPQDRDSLCRGMVIPKYPESGGACKGKLVLEFKILGHGACTDTAFVAALLAGDSIEIEIAKNEDFTNGLIHVVVSSANAELAIEKLADLAGYKGVIFWRGRILHAKDMAMAKTTAVSKEEWSLSRPLVVDMSGNPIAIRSSMKAILIQGRSGTFIAASADSPEPSLYDLAGKHQYARFRKVPGGWELEPAGRSLSGLFFIAR